jgi:hypothetical protein
VVAATDEEVPRLIFYLIHARHVSAQRPPVTSRLPRDIPVMNVHRGKTVLVVIRVPAATTKSIVDVETPAHPL